MPFQKKKKKKEANYESEHQNKQGFLQTSNMLLLALINKCCYLYGHCILHDEM